MDPALRGKVAILTGAAGGQGRVAARIFAEAGALMVLTDRDERGAAVASALGDRALFLPHDVTRPQDWAMVITAAEQRYGGVDILINNAGIAARDTVPTLGAAQLQRILEVNLFGALNGIQAAMPSMQARGGGAIVNIGSIAGLRSTAGLAGYSISKWALRGLSRNAAVDLAPYGIRVNLILPGAVEVSMIKDGAAPTGKASVAAQTPLGRVARADEIARTALFLASGASSYITGAEFIVDGGMTA